MNDRAAYANADARRLPLADKSVHMIATSPPYWGLRSYDTGDQKHAELGAEPLHDCLAWARGDDPCGACYVCNMREWAREMCRVLRDDGVLFLNLADSYSSGGQRAISYGTSDKEPEDCLGRDCSSENPCDACRGERRHISRTDDQHVPMQALSPSVPNRGNREFATDHLPTSDSYPPASRNANAIRGFAPSLGHESGQPRASQESTPDESSRPHQGDFHQPDSFSFFQDAPLSSSGESPAFSHRMVYPFSRRLTWLSIRGLSGRKRYTILTGGSSARRTEDTAYDSYPCVDFNTTPRQAQTLPAKNLCGIPWRVALALQADGWYLRSDIIWAKPNPMPESVTDRPTKAHEYVFLLTKSARYYWDAEAVKEAGAENVRPGGTASYTANGSANHGNGSTTFHQMTGAAGRNRRSVWTVATTPYAGAHFATWPPALVELMVKAGTSERGVCPECGTPWARVVKREKYYTQWGGPSTKDAHKGIAQAQGFYRDGKPGAGSVATTTIGHRPTCAHDVPPVPAIILDPFCGSGTTLEVARRLGRIGLGFDLSETYLRDNAAVRLGHDKLAAWGRGIVDTGDYTDLFRAHANGNGARSDDHEQDD